MSFLDDIGKFLQQQVAPRAIQAAVNIPQAVINPVGFATRLAASLPQAQPIRRFAQDAWQSYRQAGGGQLAPGFFAPETFTPASIGRTLNQANYNVLTKFGGFGPKLEPPSLPPFGFGTAGGIEQGLNFAGGQALARTPVLNALVGQAGKLQLGPEASNLISKAENSAKNVLESEGLNRLPEGIPSNEELAMRQLRILRGEPVAPAPAPNITQKPDLRIPTNEELAMAQLNRTQPTFRDPEASALRPVEPIAAPGAAYDPPAEYRRPDFAPVEGTGQQRQRKFLQTAAQSDITTPEVAQKLEAVQPQTYGTQPNTQTLTTADEIVKRDPNLARQRVFSNEPVSAEKAGLAYKLVQKYQAEGNDDLAVDVILQMDKQFREAGRFIQIGSLWSQMSPETVLRTTNRIAHDIGITLPKETNTMILEKMRAVQALPEGDVRDKEMLNVLNFIAEKMPPRASEVFEAYRYQNMLSGFRTQERNIYGNLFNTLITRPMDLAFEGTYDIARHPFNPLARDISLLDVPRYYKDIFTSLPNAFVAAKQAFKMGDISRLDLAGARGDTAIQAARSASTPLVVSALPRFMQAMDSFFSTMIAAGEKARLLAHGAGEEEAIQQAGSLAEKYLLREKLGTGADMPLVTRALDSLGQFAMQGRRLPVVGKVYSWFVPFITTPINAAKVMVDHSPLGFIPGSFSAPGGSQVAKATAGSLVTAYGAFLALQDKVTWDAPTDAQAKDNFYASGRKPFSVMIGDRWVPLWYFGPYALSMAIPAAIKYQQQDSKTALTDDQLTKIANMAGSLSKFVISQSSLESVGTFFRMLDGDTDLNVGSILGFTGGQLVPLQGLLRNVAQWVDPVYRKAGGFTDSIKRDIPELSKSLPFYSTPLGEPSKRDPFNRFLPYDTGKADKDYEDLYQLRNEQLQGNAVINKAKKDEERKLLQEQAGVQAAETNDFPGKDISGSNIDAKTFAATGSDSKSLTRATIQEELARNRVKLRGKVEKVGDKIFYLDNDQVKTIDLGEITKEQSGISKYTQKSKQYAAARKIFETEALDDQTKQDVYTRLGLKKPDVEYDYLASQDSTAKAGYIADGLGRSSHQEVLTALQAGRAESVSGNVFVDNATVDKLNDLGLISDAEAKALKKLKHGAGAKQASGSGGGVSSKKRVQQTLTLLKTIQKASTPPRARFAPVKPVKVPSLGTIRLPRTFKSGGAKLQDRSDVDALIRKYAS
jgi:hypothetical protein